MFATLGNMSDSVAAGSLSDGNYNDTNVHPFTWNGSKFPEFCVCPVTSGGSSVRVPFTVSLVT